MATHEEEFRAALSEILTRPVPPEWTCRCCGATISTQPTMLAQCLFTGLRLPRFVRPSCDAIAGPAQLLVCDEAELGRLYALCYQFFKEGDTSFAQERTVRSLGCYGPCVNIACGEWPQIGHLRNDGIDVWGFEPYQPNASPYIVTTLDALPLPVDGVCSNNYLEHVQDPTAFLLQCAQMLRPSGKMIHSTGCYDYVASESPFHLHFLCGRSPEACARRAGLVFDGLERNADGYLGHFRKAQ